MPLLSNFIKLNPGVDMSDPLKKFQASNGAIAAHTHELPNDIMQKSSGKITVNIKIPGNADDSPAKVSDTELLGAIHVVGTVKGKIAETEYEISNFKQSEITITGGACSQTGMDIETTPNYNLLPVMVYIGKKAG